MLRDRTRWGVSGCAASLPWSPSSSGFTLVGFVVAEHLFSRSADAQTIADHYRPLLSGPGLAGLRGGFDELKAAGAELGDTAAPPPAADARDE